MPLKAYVAGRISRQEDIRDILARLRGVGIEITRDWTWTTTITNEQDAEVFRKKSYATLDPKYHEEADRDLKAVLDADIFIVLTDENGSSMYVETGAAFAGKNIRNTPQLLYAIGPHFDRMVFYQHNDIIRVTAVDEILADLQKRKLI
jgi:hypothetical protein